MMFNDDSLVGRPRVDTPPPPPPPPEGGHGAKRNLSSVDTDPRPPRPVRPHLTPEQSAEQARLRLTALVRTAMSPKVGGAKLKKHSVLREFELGEELGRGGFATVFLAYPRGGGDVRACKAIELTQVGNAIGQIEDEVRGPRVSGRDGGGGGRASDETGRRRPSPRSAAGPRRSGRCGGSTTPTSATCTTAT